MPVAFVSGATLLLTDVGGATSFTVAFSCGSASDRLLLVQTYVQSGSTTSVSYAGDALTNVGSAGGMVMWRKTAPAAGTNNLTLNYSTPYTNYFHSAASWSGVDQSTPLGSQSSASGTSSAPATGSITCPSGGAIFGGVRNDYTTSGTATAGSGTTLVGAARSGSTGFGKAGGRRASTGTLSWSLPMSTGWGVQAFPINASASFTASEPLVVSQAISGSVI